MPRYFDEIDVGNVVSLGAAAVDAAAWQDFIDSFTPGWTLERGLPTPWCSRRWSKSMPARRDSAADQAGGVDALRWARATRRRGRAVARADDDPGQVSGRRVQGNPPSLAQHDRRTKPAGWRFRA